jgi:hypothetical protein
MLCNKCLTLNLLGVWTSFIVLDSENRTFRKFYLLPSPDEKLRRFLLTQARHMWLFWKAELITLVTTRWTVGSTFVCKAGNLFVCCCAQADCSVPSVQRAVLLRVKRPEHEAGRSFLPSIEVLNAWSLLVCFTCSVRFHMSGLWLLIFRNIGSHLKSRI